MTTTFPERTGSRSSEKRDASSRSESSRSESPLRAKLGRLLALDAPMSAVQAAEVDRARAVLAGAEPEEADGAPLDTGVDDTGPAALTTPAAPTAPVDDGTAGLRLPDGLATLVVAFVHDAGGPDRTASPTEVLPGARSLDATLSALERVQAEIGRLEAARAVLAARLAAQTVEHESALLDGSDPAVARAGATRRHELAERAVVADLATALRLGEVAAGNLLDHSRTLVHRAPRMLGLLAAGRTSWRHAGILAGQVGDLDARAARAVQDATLADASHQSPRQFAQTVRRARERVHPTPADVRRSDAEAQRAVYLDPGRDGMAWLAAHLPAPLAHAAHDRLTRVAARARADGDERTGGQLRADVLCDLLLDDGTLEHSATSAGDGAVQSDRPADASPMAGRDDEARGPAALGASNVGPRRPARPLAALARSIRPRVNVTVPVLTLLGLADEPAALDGTVPIDPQTARELTALAPTLRRVLTHPETGTTLSVGRTSYTVPADLKALLVERDATCRFPGCTRPAERSDLDHTTAWADGGSTGAGNLAHLCRKHHVTKHQTSWTVRHTDDDDGTLAWTSPTERIHHTFPSPPATTRHSAAPRGPTVPPDPHDGPLLNDSGPPPF